LKCAALGKDLFQRKGHYSWVDMRIQTELLGAEIVHIVSRVKAMYNMQLIQLFWLLVLSAVGW